MKANRWWVALLCGAALAVPTLAQDEPETKPDAPAEAAPKGEAPAAPAPKKPYVEPPLKRWGGIELSVGAWQPDLAGADYRAAAVLQSGRQGIVSQVLELPANPVVRATAQARWLLPGDRGSVDFAYDSIHQSSHEQKLTPGNFQYAELGVLPTFAGVADDGLADGFRADSLTKSRRFRVEYAATAFKTARSKGTWHAGLHSVDYSRHFETHYYALAPNLPPTIPPIFSSGTGQSALSPRPDSSISDATFSGTGPAGGLDLSFEIVPRVSIVGGFSLAILDGKLDTKYNSITYTYYLEPGADTPGGFLTYSGLLYALDNPDLANLVVQLQAPFNLADNGSRHVAEEVEAYLGVEGRVWSTLHAYARFRGLVLANVGADARPSATYFDLWALGVSQEARSAGYVGFEVGFSYRF